MTCPLWKDEENERLIFFLKMPFNGTMNKIRHEHVVVVEKMSLKKSQFQTFLGLHVFFDCFLREGFFPR